MTIDLIIVVLLLLIASQTSYAAYRTWRGTTLVRHQSVFIDTSVLMDGRIVSIASSGFIPRHLIIPRSVIGELQFLADNGDSEKRERARRGLDVVRELQSIDNIDVEIMQDGSKAEEGVDERLLSLAKKHSALLCTIDFNLNKVARVENIVVLNVNELAQQLRMSYLPGDRLSLELTTAGSDNHQAVGHLPDGTMVVVEHAKNRISQIVEVEIIRSLQTAAGRMMFAKLAAAKSSPRKNSSPDGRKTDKKPTENTKSSTRRETATSGRATTPKPAPQRRRPSSVQREASLVDLIDRQS